MEHHRPKHDRVHTPTRAIISPTLISIERYEWLHDAHIYRNRPEDFIQDLFKLLARYPQRAKSLNPQGRHLKMANYWAIVPTLRQALERTVLTITELFGSPLNCSMTGDITYCSAFPEDATFGAVINSFH
jgi:hypothetical protein